MEPRTPTQSMTVPIAIVLGFGLIAVAIYFASSRAQAPQPPADATAVEEGAERTQMRPVTEADHIRGNPNAPIMLVEYSDFDCPFCKSYHETMRQVMDEYGTTGEVAWVYRHFPLAQIHPNAPVIAEASECVSELANDSADEAFWTFADQVFDERDVNAPTNITRLEEFAVSAGVEAAAFNECMESERNRGEVEADLRDALAVGAEGTPYTVVLVGDQQAPIEGAQDYGTVRNIIENLLSQIEGRQAGESASQPAQE